MIKDKHYRSFLKGISWRIVGTLDTVIVSFFCTQNPLNALKMRLTKVLTKIVLYYGHERLYWKAFGEKIAKRKISLVKGMTWRFVGSIDTILIAWIYTKKPLTGFKIGATEFLTKILLYNIHERAWNKVKLGTLNEKL